MNVESLAERLGRRTTRRGREHYYPDASDADWNDWRWQFRHRVTTLEELARFLPIPAAEWAARSQVLSDFRMGITPYYLSLIDADDPNDPLLRQVVPLAEENLYRAVGDEDPLGEEKFSPVPGITHRYPDRVLMVLSNNCAIYCRYCTRKRTMYDGASADVEIDRMVDYIARTPSVRDVVVSGGDPLNFATAKLDSILSKLRAIPHLEIIRIGTRVPVALPQRIDDELCEMLARHHPLWINVHYNHPNELTPDAARACDKLSRAGVPLNNQAVLLKGVNDDVATIKALCHGLMKMRVRPYYLYQCDPVRGAEHFRTPIAKGIEIIEGLRGHTSGLAIPTYVIDAPGGGGKIPVQPDYLLHYDREKGRALLRNYQGKLYEYLEPRAANASPNDVLVPAAPPAASGPVALAGSNKKRVEAASAGAPSSNGNGHAAGATGNGTPAGNGQASGNGSSASNGRNGAAPVVGKSKWVHRGSTRAERAARTKKRDK
ncbi:MAG: KamA family radical SAM protein [Planctomycetes bacterium]|nr:KamA family radical SAM protein [Planctomycetota bacterium]